MLTLIGRRVVQLIPTLFFVSVIIFSLQQLLPGDPALIMAGEDRDPAVIEQIRRQYRLGQPIPGPYVYWVKGGLTSGPGGAMRIKQKGVDPVPQKIPGTKQPSAKAILISPVIR